MRLHDEVEVETAPQKRVELPKSSDTRSASHERTCLARATEEEPSLELASGAVSDAVPVWVAPASLTLSLSEQHRHRPYLD